MLIEDGAQITKEALDLLIQHKDDISLPHLTIQTLPEFVASIKANGLSLEDRRTLVDQALILFENFYAHLPFKRSRYAVDPLQRLQLLRARLGSLRDFEFHSELQTAFVSLRDAHTVYGLPAPYKGQVAFLPFRLDCIRDQDGNLRFVVTALMEGFKHPYFGLRAEVTGWNGMRVLRAIQRVAEGEPGANPDANFARGLRRLTVRPLTTSLPPDEFVVLIQYKPWVPEPEVDGEPEERAIVLPWNVGGGFSQNVFRSASESISESQEIAGFMHQILWSREELRYVKELLAAKSNLPATEPQTGSSATDRTPVDTTQVSKLPKILDYQFTGGLAGTGRADPQALCLTEDPEKRFGYIRIRTFKTNDPDGYFAEFLRLLLIMKDKAPDGLILDVRGNPGGEIPAAERLLQLLTSREITPASFHFPNTPPVRQLVESLEELEQRGPKTAEEFSRVGLMNAIVAKLAGGLKEAAASGELLTAGVTLTDPKTANDTGQVYQAPVVLLTDATSYSSADMFAAGFQDHDIGTIIGIHENTGGGGGQRWDHQEDLVAKQAAFSQVPLRPLPREATFSIAIRRSIRTGRQNGLALEDLGVVSDDKHLPVTWNDLVNDSEDLLRYACGKLAAQQGHRLEIVSTDVVDGSLQVRVRTVNLARLVFHLNGAPRLVAGTMPDADPQTGQLFSIPLDDPEDNGQVEIRIRGLARRSGVGTSIPSGMQLVAAARASVKVPESTLPAAAG